ncbi:hypothetical protein [Streptomyces sp. XD-27]|uniref:hypothetical protein n=1 Tax=Streptomyces sp. XD-27 TaxID=3062779 RepID=UPI0026F4588C|nr:hypothetical protein [Streptomyces sp. XD-27]WKX70514.1 hypothetical protein Q3Y56_11830 [Streptomyces sp. XD-27]
MTNEETLAICRSNWEYRGIDDASVRDMVNELSAHLEDAQAAGRTARDVVGDDVPAFAASWARARTPFPRRALRMASLTCFVLGCMLLLLGHLLHWTTRLSVNADNVALYAAAATVTVVLELRRGSLGLGRTHVVFLAAGLPAAFLTWWLVGDAVLCTLPLWVTPVLLLPGLPYAVADARARKSAVPSA